MRRRPSDTTGRPAQVVFAALVLACFAAFAITQHLKHLPTVVQNFMLAGHFEPSVPGPHALEHISFRIAHSDQVSVAIVNSNGDVVVTLVRDRPLVAYTQLSLVWDGRRGPTGPVHGTGVPRDPLFPSDRGAVAGKGEYRVQVSLRHRQHTVLSPRTFVLQ